MTAQANAITLTQRLVAGHDAYGDRVALRIKRDDAWHELTYSQLLGASQRLAAELVGTSGKKEKITELIKVKKK